MGKRGTRERLNWGFFQGSLLLACLMGLVVDSSLAFGIALAAGIGMNIYFKEIRLRNNR